MFLIVSVVPSFSLLSNIPLYRWAMVGLPIHSLNVLLHHTEVCATSHERKVLCFFSLLSQTQPIREIVAVMCDLYTSVMLDCYLYSISWSVEKCEEYLDKVCMFSFSLPTSISTRFLSILNTDLVSISYYTLKQV